MKYKYRLYPTVKQELKLLGFCGAQRFVWNYFLVLEIERYKKDGKFNFMVANAKLLTQLKKTPGHEWMNDVPVQAFQQTLRNLDKALKQSFRGKANRKGFPKFKCLHHNNKSFSLAMVSTKSNIRDGGFICTNFGKKDIIKMVMDRELPSDFASCTVKCEKNGMWHVIFTVKKVRSTPVTEIKKIIGLDFNSKNIIVDSNGKIYENPKFFAKAKVKLARAQRRLSKKVKGSANHKKAKSKVAKLYAKVSAQRKDFLDKLSYHYQIVQDNDLITIEDLNVAGMAKFNGHMVQDAGWRMLRTMIVYKADLYGKHVSIISRWFPSTKMCSGCGQLADKKLSEREHNCDCGLSISRDLNAAINIRAEGIDLFKKTTIGQGLPDFKPVEIV
ncbi:MAG: transposase [Ghiorsea sp.]